MSDGPSHTGILRAFSGGGRSSSLAACLYMAVVVVACDESFEPIAPTEFAYSVFGYLDASADTQWIRVMPIRLLTATSQDAPGAAVTLEHLETGRIFELRDSLFRFLPPLAPALGSEGEYVHNFWTPEDIEPGATYRFSARLEGEEPAEAVVEIPRDYEVVLAINKYPQSWPPDELRISGVKHLPFVWTAVYFEDECGSGVIWEPYGAHSAENGIHVIPLEPLRVFARPDCGQPVVTQGPGIWIVGSEMEWPVGGEYSPRAMGQLGRTSNVTNSVGYLGGVLVKTIPYER